MMDDKKLKELVLFETDKIKDMSDDEMIAEAKIELGRVFAFFNLMATTSGADDSMAVLYIVAYLAKFIFVDGEYSYSEQRFLEEVFDNDDIDSIVQAVNNDEIKKMVQESIKSFASLMDTLGLDDDVDYIYSLFRLVAIACCYDWELSDVEIDELVELLKLDKKDLSDKLDDNSVRRSFITDSGLGITMSISVDYGDDDDDESEDDDEYDDSEDEFDEDNDSEDEFDEDNESTDDDEYFESDYEEEDEYNKILAKEDEPFEDGLKLYKKSFYNYEFLVEENKEEVVKLIYDDMVEKKEIIFTSDDDAIDKKIIRCIENSYFKTLEMASKMIFYLEGSDLTVVFVSFLQTGSKKYDGAEHDMTEEEYKENIMYLICHLYGRIPNIIMSIDYFGINHFQTKTYDLAKYADEKSQRKAINNLKLLPSANLLMVKQAILIMMHILGIDSDIILKLYNTGLFDDDKLPEKNDFSMLKYHNNVDFLIRKYQKYNKEELKQLFIKTSKYIDLLLFDIPQTSAREGKYVSFLTYNFNNALGSSREQLKLLLNTFTHCNPYEYISQYRKMYSRLGPYFTNESNINVTILSQLLLASQIKLKYNLAHALTIMSIIYILIEREPTNSDRNKLAQLMLFGRFYEDQRVDLSYDENELIKPDEDNNCSLEIRENLEEEIEIPNEYKDVYCDTFMYNVDTFPINSSNDFRENKKEFAPEYCFIFDNSYEINRTLRDCSMNLLYENKKYTIYNEFVQSDNVLLRIFNRLFSGDLNDYNFDDIRQHLESLLKCGLDINTVFDNTGITLLHAAVANYTNHDKKYIEKLDSLVKFIVKNGGDPFKKSNWGTPIDVLKKYTYSSKLCPNKEELLKIFQTAAATSKLFTSEINNLTLEEINSYIELSSYVVELYKREIENVEEESTDEEESQFDSEIAEDILDELVNSKKNVVNIFKGKEEYLYHQDIILASAKLFDMKTSKAKLWKVLDYSRFNEARIALLFLVLDIDPTGLIANDAIKKAMEYKETYLSRRQDVLYYLYQNGLIDLIESKEFFERPDYLELKIPYDEQKYELFYVPTELIDLFYELFKNADKFRVENHFGDVSVDYNFEVNKSFYFENEDETLDIETIKVRMVVENESGASRNSDQIYSHKLNFVMDGIIQTDDGYLMLCHYGLIHKDKAHVVLLDKDEDSLDYAFNNVLKDTYKNTEMNNVIHDIFADYDPESKLDIDDLTDYDNTPVYYTDTLVRVKFDDGLSYEYNCDLDVAIGSKVSVTGKRKDQVGYVISVGGNKRNGYEKVKKVHKELVELNIKFEEILPGLINPAKHVEKVKVIRPKKPTREQLKNLIDETVKTSNTDVKANLKKINNISSKVCTSLKLDNEYCEYFALSYVVSYLKLNDKFNSNLYAKVDSDIKLIEELVANDLTNVRRLFNNTLALINTSDEDVILDTLKLVVGVLNSLTGINEVQKDVLVNLMLLDDNIDGRKISKKVKKNFWDIDYSNFTDEDCINYLKDEPDHDEYYTRPLKVKGKSIGAKTTDDYVIQGNMLIEMYTDFIPDEAEIIGQGAGVGLEFDEDETLVIPEGIVAIEGGAFSQVQISSITLPNSLRIIGPRAFYCNELLEEIIIPEGVQVIGKAAFAECRGLKRVVLPSTLIKIDESAFTIATSLKEIIIPEGVKFVGKDAFSYTDIDSIICESKKYIDKWDELWNSNGFIGLKKYVVKQNKKTNKGCKKDIEPEMVDEIIEAILSADLDYLNKIASEYNFLSVSDYTVGMLEQNPIVHSITLGSLGFNRLSAPPANAASIAEEFKVLKFLKEQGFDFNTPRSNDNMTILLSVIMSYAKWDGKEEYVKQLDEIVAWLLDNGASPNIDSCFFGSALHTLEGNSGNFNTEMEDACCPNMKKLYKLAKNKE